MHSEEELIKIVEKENLDCFKLSFDYEDNDDIIMLDVALEEIIKFAKKRNIKELFYKFNYSSKEVLSITEENMKRTMEKVDVPYKEIWEVIKPIVEEYNDKVSKLDFSRPHSLLIFSLYQGQRIGIFETNLWFLENEVMLPEYALENIVSKNEDLIKKYILEKEDESKEIEEEFHQYLLNDEKFHKCTNASLRTTYAMELYRDKDHQNFKKAFIKGTDYQRYNQYAEFIEMVWKEYKEILKKERLNFYPKRD